MADDPKLSYVFSPTHSASSGTLSDLNIQCSPRLHHLYTLSELSVLHILLELTHNEETENA